MGNIRARSDFEIEARRTEIINAAEELFLSENYQDITLATIAEKTSLSRPSMYNYYKLKEEVFLDLSKREYLNWKTELEKTFTKRMSHRPFCKKLSESLLGHETRMKLLSLHTSILEEKCGEEMMFSYKQSVQPFFDTFSDILLQQFPNSSQEERDLFKAHFFLYSYSLYPFIHIPENQQKVMAKLNTFGNISNPKEVFSEGIFLLSSHLT